MTSSALLSNRRGARGRRCVRLPRAAAGEKATRDQGATIVRARDAGSKAEEGARSATRNAEVPGHAGQVSRTTGARRRAASAGNKQGDVPGTDPVRCA